MRIDVLRPAVVEFVPEPLEPGVLYIALKYQVAVHLCPCGCANRAVTPLDSPSGWQLTMVDGQATLHPSLLHRFECKSHYFIVKNRVQWL